MMKKILSVWCLMAVCVTALAVPAKPGLWSTITLADGTQVRAQVRGDEYVHYMQDAEGNCYTMEGETFVKIEREKLQARATVRRAARKITSASTSNGLGKEGTMSRGAVPSIGEYTIPVVMVQFSDKKFKSTTTVEKMMRYYNEEGYHDETTAVGSVRDFFKQQSGGRFVPTFDVVGIVSLDQNESYYGKDVTYGDDNLDALPGDVVKAAVEQLGTDFSKYVVPAGDAYHKKGVPLLCMLYAGEGQATVTNPYGTGYSSLIWPCEWDCDATYEGVHFNSCFVGNEIYGNRLMGHAVFCHEFSHALGLPDFYCTDESYSNDDSFGHWSLMDTGAYVDNYCFRPAGYTAYERSYMGWLDIKELTEEGTVTLGQFDDNSGNPYALRIKHPTQAGEYFIIENRQPDTWRSSSFGSGLMLTRFGYNQAKWYANEPNNIQNAKRAMIVTANGAKLNYSASQANLYGNGKTKISGIKFYGGMAMPDTLKNITKNSDGTITFTFAKEKEVVDPEPEPTPDPEIPADYLIYESFDDVNSTGGNDGKWNGNIASQLYVELADRGWETSLAFRGNQCVKLGNTSLKGEVTTPEITVSGAATLTFKAGAWDAGTENTTMILSVSNGTVEKTAPQSAAAKLAAPRKAAAAQQEVQMAKGKWTSYSYKIVADGPVKVTFAGANAKQNRFFLDRVLVVGDGSASAIKDVNVGDNANDNGSQKVFSLDGRYVGDNLSGLPRGIYVVGGKKIIR